MYREKEVVDTSKYSTWFFRFFTQYNPAVISYSIYVHLQVLRLNH